MKDKLDSLLEQMRLLEREVWGGMKRKEQESFYEVSQGKVRFTAEALARHMKLSKRFASYIRGSSFRVLATTPVIWACLIPVALIDLAMTVYQAICFPIYGIPKVNRHDYIMLDRRRLVYLNWTEKLNCEY